MGGVETNGNKHTRKDHALICCSNDELQKKEREKKNSLGGACIRIGDRNYVMRTGKRDWREGVDGDSAFLHGYARRPTGCMRASEWILPDRMGARQGESEWPSSQARPTPAQLRERRWSSVGRRRIGLGAVVSTGSSSWS